MDQNIAERGCRHGVLDGVRPYVRRDCRCPRWVKTGKARSEHKISALPLKADIGADIVFVRSVPKADIATPHSITSLARSRIEVGNSTPIALAVLRLTANSNLVGSSTGRSTGLVPCRILATKLAL